MVVAEQPTSVLPRARSPGRPLDNAEAPCSPPWSCGMATVTPPPVRAAHG